MYPCNTQGLCGFFWCFVLVFCYVLLLFFGWCLVSGTGWVRNNQLVASRLDWSNEGKLVYAFLECHKAHMGLLLSTGHPSPRNKQPLRPTPPQTTYRPQPPGKSTLLCKLLYTQTSMSIFPSPYSPLSYFFLSVSSAGNTLKQCDLILNALHNTKTE